MALASLDDINTHLPEDKLSLTEGTDDRFQIDAERIVRGYLAGAIPPVTLAAWVDPDSTPELIRAIVGRLIAAAYYAQRYSEDSTEVPEYAQDLYNKAISQLERIQAGTLELVDIDDLTLLTSNVSFDSDDFYPNDTAPEPVFRMGMDL